MLYMDPISIITLLGIIISFIMHAVHVRNSRCRLGHIDDCFSCNAEGDIDPNEN